MCARERRFCKEPRLSSFPFPFSLKGMQGDFLFSPSLFFDFADGDAPPVDNLSVFIGFSFLVYRAEAQSAAAGFVFTTPIATRPRENRSDKKSRRVKRPDGNKKFSGMEAAYLRGMAKRGIMATLRQTAERESRTAEFAPLFPSARFGIIRALCKTA
jgi:hypothetical protein